MKPKLCLYCRKEVTEIPKHYVKLGGIYYISHLDCHMHEEAKQALNKKYVSRDSG